MHENIEELFIILKSNDVAINLLLNFIAKQKNSNNVKKILAYVKNALHQENQELLEDLTENAKIISQLASLENAINEINLNMLDSVDYIPQTYLPLFANKKILEISTIKQFNLDLTKLFANNINLFRDKDLIYSWKIMIHPETKQPINTPISYNTAIFRIPLGYDQFLELDECWCTTKLSRNNKYNQRTILENKIFKKVKFILKDLNNIVRIINIGSDRIGLLIVLAKLNIYGFTNIEILNIEHYFMKNYQDYPSVDQKYAELIKQTFGNTYNYKVILNENNNLFNAIKELPDSNLTVVFAEDLGGVNRYDYTYRYDQAVNQVLTQLQMKLRSEKENILLLSKYNGELLDIKITKNQKSLKVSYA